MSVQPNTPAPKPATRKVRHTRWTLLRFARRLDNAAEVLEARGDGNQATQLRILAQQHRARAMRARWF